MTRALIPAFALPALLASALAATPAAAEPAQRAVAQCRAELLSLFPEGAVSSYRVTDISGNSRRTRVTISVTAEGVETADDFTRMRDLGCHQIQGYLFGRPMTFEKASELVSGTQHRLSA